MSDRDVREVGAGICLFGLLVIVLTGVAYCFTISAWIGVLTLGLVVMGIGHVIETVAKQGTDKQ